MVKPVNIIRYNLSSYQAFLENEFLSFLEQQGTSSKTRKNYRSDLRHFLSWTLVSIQTLIKQLPANPTEILAYISPELLSGYRNNLIKRQLAPASINRQLSTVRSFFRFCQNQSWISHDPTVHLANLSTTNAVSVTSQLLVDFSQHLARQGASKITVKNYTSDVRLFLGWLETHQN